MVTSLSSLITRVQRQELTPLLLSGQVIRIDPFGFFVIPKGVTPEIIPWRIVNIPTAWTTPLKPLLDSGSTTPLPRQITEMDQNPLNLAQYRLIVYDPRVDVQVSQPLGTSRYVTKAGALYINARNTMWHLISTIWPGMIPELYVFENQTPVTLTAMSRDYESIYAAGDYFARVIIGGFRYPLASIDVDPAKKDQVVALTLSVQATG